MKLEFVEFKSGDAMRKGNAVPKSINANILISNAEAEKDRLKIDFEYGVSYQPDQSYVRMKGSATFIGPEAAKSVEEWKKTKKITGEHGEFIFNALYYHCSINALLITRVFGIAPPIALPTLKIGVSPKGVS
ncbi:MAG: hypothetical protein QXH30_01145 [Candidatus Bilamarchaeaceae archaeon]